MKIKNSQIINFFTSVDPKGKKLPIRLLYALSMNLKAVVPAVNAYNEQRSELINKYAKKDDGGEAIVEDDHYIFDDVNGWNEAITELMETETEIPVTMVPISTLEKCDGPTFDDLSLDEIAAIDFMIEKN